MATDFFAAQDAARGRSHKLVALFLASVAGLIAAIYFAVAGMLVAGGELKQLWDPTVFLWVAGLTILLVGLSSLGKIMSLRAGGGAVARSVGGRPVDPTTSDPDERRLVNVVEEMAIASGVQVPDIYVMDSEEGINAFAAGFATADAAVCVTRGCMKQLNRDELQGVVAHEFSHILNGDMRLNIQLIGLVFGLLVLSIVGQGMMRVVAYSGSGRRRGDKDGGAAIIVAILALGAILFVAGWIGVLFGRLLQSAVSRQREFLADASAVQFTRNPDGLAGALRKIGAAGSRVTNPHGQDVAHLFFANGLKLGWAGLFATHPPLADRIRAIDPSWDGSFGESEDSAPAAMPAEGAMGFAPRAAPSPLAQARAVRSELSALLGDEWLDPQAARDLALALLPPGSDTSGVRDYRAKIAAVPPEQRLALVGMLMPSLGRLPEEERHDLLDQLERVSQQGLDAFSFGVWWVLRRQLQRKDLPARPRERHNSDPAAFASDVSALVASLALVGGAGDEAALWFADALSGSPSFGPVCEYPPAPPDVNRLEQALQHLGESSFALRKEVIAAATRAVARDGKITPSEAALMQLVALALDCPAPLPDIAAEA